MIVCQLDKPFNFLAFEFLSFGAEREHLKQFSVKDRKNLIEQAKELSQKGYSQRNIAKKLSISLGEVNKYLKM